MAGTKNAPSSAIATRQCPDNRSSSPRQFTAQTPAPRERFHAPSPIPGRIRIGVIGCGHWGPNHIRNFSAVPGVEVAGAADSDTQRLGAVARTYPIVPMSADPHQLVNDPDIDALVIATPAGTHYDLAKAAMIAGKDVLCEKPLAVSSRQCRELVDIAESEGRILMVGHVFLFNPGVRKLRELIQDGKVGRVYYAHATRTNLGPIRQDVNAAWDLASHDVSTLNCLFGSPPLRVSASGGRFLQRDIEDVVFLSLQYPKGVLANIHVSWMNPKKVRELTVVGDKTMVVWNDLAPEGPVRVYDKGVLQEPYYDTFGEFQLSVREGDIAIPRVRMTEPLRLQADHFIECVQQRRQPISDGRTGLDVVRTLEAVDASLAQYGASIALEG